MSIAIAVVAGLLVGVVMGALGGGGAIITVPVLVYALGKTPHEASTAALVIVGLSALVALVPHARRGNVRWSQGVVFGVIGIAGTTAGSALSARLDPRWLMVGFAVLLLVVATLMWSKARRARRIEGDVVASQTPGEPTSGWYSSPGGIAQVALAAAGVGLLTGFFGVGGGFAIVPALVIILGFRMPVAVATSLFIMALNSTSAFVSRIGGDVTLDWPVVIAFTLTAMTGSLVGARVTARLKPTTLQQSFAALLVVVAAYTAINSIVQLA